MSVSKEDGQAADNEACIVSRLFPSLGLSVFGSVGLALLLIVSGLYKDGASSVLEFLLKGSPFVIATFSGLFLTVYTSLRRITSPPSPETPTDLLLNIATLVIVIAMGLLCMYYTQASVNWWWLLTVIALGGLCGVFHGWHMYFCRTRIAIKRDVLKIKGKKAMEIFVKSQELEHNFFQSYFTAFASATMLFFTAAVVGYYLRTGISPLSLINASIVAAWFVAGLFYGIFIPIQKHLEWIRSLIRKIAQDMPEKP
jgi:hypothetical protein